MAKISTYPIISIPTFNDLLIGTDVENLNETKNFSLGDIQNLIVTGNYVPYIGANQDVFLGAFNITANSFINSNGTSLDFLKADGSLDSTVYQPAGDYITDLSGEATASGPGIATVTLDNGAVIGKVLTGLTITGGSVSSTDSILQAFGKLQNQVNGLFGGAIYQGTWDALTNTPLLQSGIGVQGYYYIVNVAGSTNLDGITDWNVGDWAIFDGTAWQQVDNTDTVVSVNGQVGVVVLTTTNIAEGTNLYFTDSRSRLALSLATTGNSGASTYDNTTGAFNIPNYTLSGLGGVPSTRQLTINGTAYDLSADRSWSVGTVTSVGTSGPLTGGTITGIGTIGITQSGGSSDGYLSSTDWNTFNNKQNALINPVTGTGTIYYLPMWTGVSALSDSIISYASNVVTYNYNSVSGATINYTNTSGTTYTYTIQMNNTGSPRQTYHSYTDGNVLQQINGNVVSKNLQSGQLVLPYYTAITSFSGTSLGYLGFDSLGNILTVAVPSLTGYVPYTGATQSVNLGEFGLSTGNLIFDTTPTGIPTAQGTMYWDDSKSTVALIMNGTTQHLGQDTYFYVKNSSGSPIPKGTAVMFAGTDGASGHILIAPFLANGGYPSSYFIGLTSESISNGSFGQVVNFGELEGINTSAYSAGTLLYASSTVAGGFQTTAPVAPNNIILVAATLNSKNNGAIIVRITLGSNINDDEGVLITTPSNNQGIFYDSTSTLWVNKTIATALGYTPVPTTRMLTINGTAYDLSADRSWSVGTVTSITAGAGLDGGTITTTGTISHGDTSSQASVDNTAGFVIQDVTLDTYGHVTGIASVDFDLRYVPLTRTLNGLALSSNQTFATGTTGTDFNIVSTGTVHTFNIPDASASARGFLSTGTQTIGGTKTFTNSPTVPSLYLTNMGAGSGALYYNIGESRLTLANYNVGGKVMIEVNGGNYTASFNSDLTIQLLGYTTNGILRTSSSNGTLTVDTTAYTPQSRTLSINGTTYDLTANRSWSVGTVTSVNMSVPTGFTIGGNPITSSGTLALTFSSGYSLPTNAVQAEWDDAYDNRITSLTTTGTSGASTLISHVLNIPQYQAQGNYITSLTGEATASGPGAASVTLSNSAVTGKVLTGLTVTGTTVIATDSILTAFGKLQGQVNALVGGLQYQGTWNANTNSPTITSGVGTDGYFYIVSVAGTTNIDGINDWQIGDWIVFHNTSWEKVDNTDSVTSVNGFTGAVTLTTSNISEGTNLYYLDSRARAAISLTTTGNSGASTYSNLTGIINVPQYSLAGLGGVPDTRQLTINGTAFDLSANRSWSVGTVTSIATTGPITGGTITGSGSIGITQATTSSNGYLSSTDWNTFNGKQNAITLTTTGNNGSSTLIGATLNIPSYTLTGLGGVPSTRTLTINGTSFDLSVNRTWSVGTVTSITFSGPLTGGTITGSGTVGITQSSGSANGYLSSTDWTTFNSKQNTISVTAPITLVGSTLSITQATTSTNGFLSSTDWNTFNNKQNTLSLTTTGTSGAATLVGATLNIPQYQSVITNPVTGTGTQNYISKWNNAGGTQIGNSLLFDSGSGVGLGTASINASALFQMDSTTKGFLVPRMTSAQRIAIATPSEGLIVYQTNSVIGLYIYSNGTWRSLTMV